MIKLKHGKNKDGMESGRFGISPIYRERILREAFGFHRSGQFAEAETGYRRLLSIDAGDADGWHLLGMIAFQHECYDRASVFISRAIVVQNASPLYFMNLGNALHQLGRHEDAITALRRSIELDPRPPAVHSNLGALLTAVGQPEQAVTACRQALERDPQFAPAYCNLGNAQQELGRLAEAAAAYRSCLGLDRSSFEAQRGLSRALAGLGRPGEAMVFLGDAVRQRPAAADLRGEMAALMKSRGRLGEAATWLQSALALQPDDASVTNRLGVVTKKIGVHQDALLCFGRAFRLDRDFATALCNLAAILCDMEEVRQAEFILKYAAAIGPGSALTFSTLATSLDLQEFSGEAERLHARAGVVDPGHPLVRGNAAMTLFRRTRLAEAWEHYEARPLPPPPVDLPRWDGQAAPGKTLLVWMEQGIADQLLGLGMIADAARLVGTVVVVCEHRLVDLIARSFPDIVVVCDRDLADPLVLAADIQCPLFSLGQWARRDLADFPPHRGYLRPAADRVLHWKAWLAGLGAGPKVGFSWRSIKPAQLIAFLPTLEQLAPVFAIPGLTFVNLQYGHPEAEIAALRAATGLQIHQPEGLDVTRDLDDLAALIAALDAVAGTTSASSLMACAVGIPTCMYVYRPLDHNRMLGTDGMPWFPAAEIVSYGWGEDLPGLVDRFAVRLAGFVSR